MDEKFFSEKNVIRVWRLKDAPEEMRKMNTTDSDNGWAALIPPGFGHSNIEWINCQHFDNDRGVQTHGLPGGWILKIGIIR